MAHRRRKKPANGQQAFTKLPQNQAQSLVRGALARAAEDQQEYYSAFEGQQTGVPGMGSAPELQHIPALGVFKDFLHPAFTIFEYLNRSLPEEGWYDPSISPSNPFKFQLGSFTVPQNQALWLFDYEFTVYRQSGIDPGDFVRAEDGRYANQIGTDITISQRREASLRFQLDPQNISATRQEFEKNVPEIDGRTGQLNPTDAFNRAASNDFATTAGPGTSLQPLRSNKFGPRDGPWTLVADEGARVALNVVIFNRIRSPLAFIEGRQAGYLIHRQVSSALIQRVRPR